MDITLRSQATFAGTELCFLEALKYRRRVLGEEHPDTLMVVVSMGALLLEQRRLQEAIDLLVPAEHAVRKAFTGDVVSLLPDLLASLGRARAGLGFDGERFALAEANLLEAHAISSATTERPGTLLNALDYAQGLVDLCTAWHAAEPGDGHDTKAAE